MFKKVTRLSREWAISLFNACCNPVCGYFLMLHRIGNIEPDRLECIEELKVSTNFLQHFVDVNRSKYDYISLDEAVFRIKNPDFHKRPFMCFTLDDGFRDNLTFGLPFFEKNNIPFTVFLTVDFINKHPCFNWPFALERIVAANENLVVEGQMYSCVSPDEKNRTFASLKILVLSLPYVSFEDTFRTVFANYLTDDCFEDIMLSWKDVHSLASSSLCTIGSHSMSHSRLSNVPLEFLIYELQTSKSLIEREIGREVRYLSYPFGWKTDVSEQVFSAAKEAGYAAAFISWGGGSRKYDNNNLFCIKRQMLLEK